MEPVLQVSDWLAALAETLSSAQDLDDLEARFLKFGRDVLEAPSAGIYVLRPQTLAVQGVATYGVSDFFLARYEDVGRAADPVLQEVLRRKSAVDNRDLMTEQEWRRSALYREVLHLHSFDHITQAPILCEGEVSGIVIFASTEGWDGGSRLRLAATAIGRIVGAALLSLRRREAAERDRDQARRALDLMDQAVVVTDARSGRRHFNRRADLLLQELRSLGVEHFDDLIATPTAQAAVTTVNLPVAETSRGEMELSVRSVVAEDDAATTISVLTMRRPGTLNIPEMYARQLSPRELDVAELVIDGLHDTDIAVRLSISHHTARQYLKSVYRKLGVSSRVDLVRLVLLQALHDAGA